MAGEIDTCPKWDYTKDYTFSTTDATTAEKEEEEGGGRSID